MASKIIVFSDTNKIFGLWRAYLSGSTLKQSELLKFCRKYHITMVVSSFVIDELRSISMRKGILYETNNIESFLVKTGFRFIMSREGLAPIYNSYISDPDDAQILDDALSIDADYLLTSNIRDFNIKKIEQDFGCKVISSLDQVC